MTAWLAILAAGVLAVVAVTIYLRVYLPLLQLREALRRLAERDFRPVLLTNAGYFQETSAHVRQVSELLQQLDQQIADEGFSLRAILSSMVEGVLITDRNLRIRLVNDSLHRMFELKQSPINRSVMEVFGHHQLQLAIEQTLADGKPRMIEITPRTPTAGTFEIKHLEVYAGGVNPKPNTRPPGAVVVFHDITTVKNLEAVRREFVANVSHEFRTPLAIINGYVETLLDGALDDRPMAEKSLKTMHKNGQRLTLLIEDLLTISRMEHRSPQLEFQQVNLNDLMHRLVERLEPAFAERHSHVNIEWQEDALYAEVDPRRIEQVFANLIENALRHGPADGCEIRILGVKAGDEVEISFVDNGPGIPYEDQPHIFERFYRVHKDRSRSAGGTGLGLSIVKNIVQAHGGTVAVDSELGQGASFKVRIPFSQGPAYSTKPTEANPHAT